MNLLLRMKARLLLGLLYALEKYSTASALKAPNFEINLAEAIAIKGDPQERQAFPFATLGWNKKTKAIN